MSARLFETHRIRKTLSLDGEWRYYFPSEGAAIEIGGIEAAESILLPTPGVWEMHPSKATYRGQAIAERLFATSADGPARLVFHGVSHTCRVFLDGEEFGGHHNAYTEFSLNIPMLSAGEHKLQLWISNEHGAISALHVPNDYYNYGGVSRPVELQLLQSEVCLDWVHAAPRMENGKWLLDFDAKALNLSNRPQKAKLSVEVASARWEPEAVLLEPGESRIKGSLAVEGVQPWSPDSPALYELIAHLESESGSDDWRDRIGFRTVAVDGRRILLNGEPVFLKGFNRHEDHPDFGCAIPVESMRKDLVLFRELGANAVRTSHYPNDSRFLDLCDQMGFMVWEENHARGLIPPGGVFKKLEDHPMAHPKFREQCRLCNEEMVNMHFNHPSILLWGILNECDTESDLGRGCYSEQLEQIKSLDSSRPTTYASCYQGRDKCQDLPDVCGWNFYPNWYGASTVAEHLDGFLKEHEPLMKGKPMIVSEFGGGAIPGWRDPVRKAKWSEERQADVLRECLETYLSHSRLAGVFIWQFCDVRVDESWSHSRPRTMNNKGVVDEYRRPKLAFNVVRELLSGYKS